MDDLQIPPDVGVEIVSPDQGVHELHRKCLRYASLGIPVSLIVAPDDATVFALRPGQPLQALRGDDRIDLDDVLPGFEPTVNELFASVMDDWMFEESEPE
jgi:Uma2 family endonuclease